MYRRSFRFLWGLTLIGCICNWGWGAEGKHLFLLSGQSNMRGMDPKVSFIPAVEAAFGAENVIVVKDAEGGADILFWMVPEPGDKPSKNQGKYYQRLLEKAKAAIGDQEIATVTLVWMQGERNANTKVKAPETYGKKLNKLFDQIRTDFGKEEINVVLGRLSDFGYTKKGKMKYSGWDIVRTIQMETAAADPRIEWIDTDDLNDGEGLKNDLHMTQTGYRIMGERFAEKAIALIKAHP